MRAPPGRIRSIIYRAPVLTLCLLLYAGDLQAWAQEVEQQDVHVPHKRQDSGATTPPAAASDSAEYAQYVESLQAHYAHLARVAATTTTGTLSSGSMDSGLEAEYDEPYSADADSSSEVGGGDDAIRSNRRSSRSDRSLGAATSRTTRMVSSKVAPDGAEEADIVEPIESIAAQAAADAIAHRAIAYKLITDRQLTEDEYEVIERAALSSVAKAVAMAVHMQATQGQLNLSAASAAMPGSDLGPLAMAQQGIALNASQVAMESAAAANMSSVVAALPEPYLPLGAMVREDVVERLKAVEKVLYRNSSQRSVAVGVQGLYELMQMVEEALPSQRRTRELLSNAASTSNDGGAAAGVQDAAGGTATAPPPPNAPLSLAAQVARSQGTGLEVAGSAMFQLAALQASGLVADLLPRRMVEVMYRLHKAAQAGSVEALLSLADRFLQGHDVVRSCSTGLNYAKLAATLIAAEVEQNARFAAPVVPLSLRDRWMDGSYVANHDAENAPHLISMEEDMALRGNADAQRRMAYRRLVGRGIEADPEGAYHDFQAAAAQGDAFAMFNLGYMHLKGLYVAQNYSAAQSHFEKAAAKGLAAGYNGLGVLFWNGNGMPQNLSAALAAFERGAALNNSDSLFNLGTMYYNGIAVERNESNGVEMFKRAGQQGHWRAAFTLGLAYEEGRGVEADCVTAEAYLRKFINERAAWGDQMIAAAKTLDAGDSWGALVQYLLLAEQGSGAAAANAAWLLRQGVGMKDGPARSALVFRLYERAVRANHTGSMIELAHLLQATDAASAATSSAALPPSKQQQAQQVSEAASSAERKLLTSDVPAASPSLPSPASDSQTSPSGSGGNGSNTSSTLQRVFHLYEMAAAAEDMEGTFHMAWAYQYGVGIAPNATRARELYTKAWHAGGKTSKAMPPFLALLVLFMDAWLQPLAGPHACQRAAHAAWAVMEHVHHLLGQALPELSPGEWQDGNAMQRVSSSAASIGTVPSASTGITDSAAAGTDQSRQQDSARLPEGLGSDVLELYVDGDLLVALGMAVALIGVLVLRRRRGAERPVAAAQQAPQQVAAAPAP